MVAGGMVSGAEVRSTLIYDPQDGEWTDGPDMLEEHSGMRAVRSATASS